MKRPKMFKNVLAEYFKYFLIRERNLKPNDINIPPERSSTWFNLKSLHRFFDREDMKRIIDRYFRQIDERMKMTILKKYKHLEPYFNEKLWYMNDPASYLESIHKISKSPSPTASPMGSRENSPIRENSPGPAPRKQRPKLKLYAYTNEMPNNLPPLKRNESILLLKSADGHRLNDLNIPRPICTKIRQRCRTRNPVTKRLAKYEDDQSESKPYIIELKY